MNIKSFFCFVLTLFILKPLNAMDTIEPPPIKAKVGFEFQEANNLCQDLPHWAMNGVVIQKEPIFTIHLEGRKLFHLEIDGADIEFVTAPFSIEFEKNYLKLSIKYIEKSCAVLKTLFEKERQLVTFGEWIEKLESEIGTKEDIQLVKSNKVYPTVMESVLKTPLGWKPRFMPQVTVQHSLAYTIPLVASLFGNKNTTYPLKIITALTPALPLLSKKNELIESNSYFTEENGLIFLHALTCAGMQRSKSESLNDLCNSLYTTKQNFLDFKQADPKVSLYFLSRRPFSMVWAGVKKAKNIDSSFEQLYTDRILEGNPLFTKLVVLHFKFVNYAEEYYFGANHDRRDLSCLKDRFGELAILSQEKPDDPLSFLLEHGIMSTGMARYLFPNIAPTVKQVTDYWVLKQLFPSDTIKKCIPFQCQSNIFTFDDYLGECIRTVDNPSHTYEFDPQTMSIKKVETNVDSLSPPWLIEQPNSMGYYRYTEDFDTGYTFDDSYGEAILEIRSIKDIGKDASIAMGMDHFDVLGNFLTGHERTLLSDMKSLLCVLNKHFILTNGTEIIKNINIKANI